MLRWESLRLYPGPVVVYYDKTKHVGFCQIMCRCSTPLETAVKEKISMFCHVEPTQVKYCDSIFFLQQQNNPLDALCVEHAADISYEQQFMLSPPTSAVVMWYCCI